MKPKLFAEPTGLSDNRLLVDLPATDGNRDVLEFDLSGFVQSRRAVVALEGLKKIEQGPRQGREAEVSVSGLPT